MPARKKKKYIRIPKKITSSGLDEMHVGVVKNRNTPKAQIAFNKMMIDDAGKGMENFDKPATPVRPYEVAKEIKNYRELQGFVERFAGGMHEKEIAKLVLDYMNTKKGYNRWNILEQDNLPYVWTLLSAIDKDPKQAVGVYNIYKKNPKNEVKNPLRKFEVRTSYIVPTSIKAFQSDISGWKKLLNVGRSGNYRTGKGSSSREIDEWKNSTQYRNWNETMKPKK
tara:strand:+ start:26 stop:697 length:672 start_codon:yes stop_codon:yes gene_type:complete